MNTDRILDLIENAERLGRPTEVHIGKREWLEIKRQGAALGCPVDDPQGHLYCGLPLVVHEDMPTYVGVGYQ